MNDYKTFGLDSQLSINTFTDDDVDPTAQICMLHKWTDEHIYEHINKDEGIDITNHIIALFDIQLSDLKIPS